MDFQEKFEDADGRGYWLQLCMGNAVLDSPSLLQIFVTKGVDTAEADANGFNCLFSFMSRVDYPGDAKEYKVLLCLLSIFHNIYALDTTGNDIFAYVNELRDWPMGYATSHWDNGSYKQDLWYIALARSKLDIRHKVPPCKRLAQYTNYYTPEHYWALRHRDDWRW